MAFNGYLFINKDSNSPSLSRNTGSEAALASKVNKHVQQQRFWKSSGPRKNWYRPFVRSDSSGPSTPSSTETCFVEEVLDYGGSPGRNSPERKPLESPRRPSSSRRNSAPSKRTPRSAPREVTIKKESPIQPYDFLTFQDALSTASSRSKDPNDPFSSTVVPITPALRDVLARHLQWAVSSSITEFAIHEGIKAIFSKILTNEMHSAAFLAMATSQQRRMSDVVLPHDQSPEFYSYQATKLIREHIEANPDAVDSYVFVDVFRLGMCEWLKGNYSAARIHFAYIAQNEYRLQPREWSEDHDMEVISSEDVFLAIDIDEKPLLSLRWEPELPTGPTRPLSDSHLIGLSHSIENASSPTKLSEDIQAMGRLVQGLELAKSPLRTSLKSCFISLRSFPNFSQIDFASATIGPIWTMKRRIHATLHRLQSIDTSSLTALDDCIRRTLIILLFLGSTTPARRVARTDVRRLAARLKNAILVTRPPSPSQFLRDCQQPPQDQNPAVCKASDSALQLWMCLAGLVAAKDGPEPQQGSDDEVVQWFTKQSILLAVQVCGPNANADKLRKLLMEYLFLEHVQGDTVEMIAATIASRSTAERKIRGISQKFDFEL